MTWILTMVLRSPLWMKVAGISLVMLGVMEVRNRLEVRSKDRQIAELRAEAVSEREARVELQESQGRLQTSHNNLDLEVKRQNEAIAAVTVRAERAEAQATVRATRLIQQGQLLADALRKDTGPVRVPPGFNSLNDWMAMRLGS